MVISRAVMALAMAVGTLQVAHAATLITETVKGTISGSSTTDTLGLFGKAGANLSGQAVTIHMQYVPADFTVQRACRSALCTYDESQNSINTPASVLITVSINGQQVTYSPTSFSETIFDNYSTNSFYISSDTSSFGEGLRGCSVDLDFSAPVAFGEALSPGNQPVLHDHTDLLQFYTPASGQLPGETLNFSVTSGTV